MTTKAITVRADFAHDGIDVRRDLKTGMMPKFRLGSMPERLFFLTAKVEVDGVIPYGASGGLTVSIIGEPRFAGLVVPGVLLDVYGLPTEKIGTARVESVVEA